MIELTLGFEDPEALRTAIEKQFAKQRAFLPWVAGVAPPSPCVLLVAFRGRTHPLKGEIVYAKEDEPGRGVGLQLAALDEPALAALRAFAEHSMTEDLGALDDLVFELPEPPGPEEPAPAGPAAPGEPASEFVRDPDSDEGEGDEETRALDRAERTRDPIGHAQRMHERMRNLSGVEQRKYALKGSVAERVLLERMYGPTVWELLLASGRLSLPEVAVIARKGTVPRPLIEVIAGNAGWIASGEVQRALLSNPRSSPSVVAKVLRVLPRNDLLLVPQQTAYPLAVRQAAKNMLKA